MEPNACVCVITEYLLLRRWLVLHVRGWGLFQEQKSYNERLSKEGTENHDLVLFLSPQGDITQTPHMAHCYTEKSYSFNASSSSVKSKTS